MLRYFTFVSSVREATRERLLDVAEEVFCRLGYARTTIAELASAAGVTRPTVYAYFPSQDDVFRAPADRGRPRSTPPRGAAPHDPPETTPPAPPRGVPPPPPPPLRHAHRHRGRSSDP